MNDIIIEYMTHQYTDGTIHVAFNVICYDEQGQEVKHRIHTRCVGNVKQQHTAKLMKITE